MRAVNTVIQAAGNNRAANPDMVEDLLVLSALADSNRPKFLAEDMMLFNSILSDLFPGQTVPQPDYTDLQRAHLGELRQVQLIPTQAFLFKCIQIFEVSVLRHGFMTVGPPGAARRTALHMLNAAMTDLDGDGGGKYQTVKRYILNPKAITMGQLYGEFDENTHEWTDGVSASSTGRPSTSRQSGPTDRQWIVFDGPVDAIWIESMNTVLDDNKKLCLSSGEIIAMSPYMNMVFEVEDLAVASPATVSRVGTIFMEPEKVVGTDAQIDGWLLELDPCNPAARPEARGAAEAAAARERCSLFARTRQRVRPDRREQPCRVDAATCSAPSGRSSSRSTACYELPEGLTAALPECSRSSSCFRSSGARAPRPTPRRARSSTSTCASGSPSYKLTTWSACPEHTSVYDVALLLEEKRWVGWMDDDRRRSRSRQRREFHDIIVPTLDSVRYMSVLEQLASHELPRPLPSDRRARARPSRCSTSL